MNQRYFPSYTIGEDAYKEFNKVCKPLGKRFLLIGGKNALSVSSDKLLSEVGSEFELVDKVIYGDECTKERAEELYKLYKDKNVDFVVGAGGGKALDTSKYLAKLLGVKVVTLPTIASTCAAASALVVTYTYDHVFAGFEYLKKPAYHCFIDTRIIAEAPYKYLRSGIGDTLAKHYEVEFSQRGHKLDYSTQLGLTISSMCSEPLFKYAEAALDTCKNNEISNELEQIILAIIITTGMVSMLINPDYNGAMAHALFYGLTILEGFEDKFLHGDVVGYCTAVQLAVDNNIPEAVRILKFLKSIGIETSLSERKIRTTIQNMQPVIITALKDPDMRVIPYEVTVDMMYKGITDVEQLSENGLMVTSKNS